ncbi:hypothetical protein ASD21_00785 [Caulobacter sp. Root1455]|uniref:hypothetical protein n=1 Tax=unclassified Caulobacter TaxID=2648921 RepID=UPI0006F6B5C6|nr:MULTISPECIES: hypothetical protein [unclassified Caulobacter]KQY35826.1 hypothetical protein ASD38_04555 [Caulobacter sp. Root487D2Y]KQZ06208.1 hypothetical protein ASD21_00785 [Caulobacter sp. Root1455]
MANVRELLGAALSCPTSVSFATDIAPLFNSTDISHMKNVTGGKLDLSNYDSVVMWSSAIYGKVQSGDMPPFPAPAWTPDQVNLFGCWIQLGCKP